MNRDVREHEFQRVYAQIDLDAFTDNVVEMDRHIDSHTKIMAVVKTDGYGHGSVPLARCLEQFDFVYGYAVATAEEAFVLKKAGITLPILILGYTFPWSYEQLIVQDVRQTLFREDTLAELSETAARVGKKARVHIKVDTGMNRIGITPDEAGLAFVEKVAAAPGVEIEGIFTHFARADEIDKSHALEQLAVFEEFVQKAQERIGREIPYKHCSNSASIIELPQANMDLVRPGIILHGLWPSEEVRRDIVQLKPTLSLHSHVVYVKEIAAGQCVSYGGIYCAPDVRKVATVPVGYGDGYPRQLSGKGYVLIKGQKAPILGRVCMDQFMVDVSHIPDVKEGEHITLLGTDGRETITAEQLGELSGRFNYELVCDLGKRIPRVYVRGGQVVEARAPYAE